MSVQQLSQWFREKQFKRIVDYGRAQWDRQALDERGKPVVAMAAIGRDNELAQKLFEQLLQTGGSEIEQWRYHLGLTLQDQQKWQRAADVYTSVSDTTRWYVPASINRAHCLIKAAQPELAVKLMQDIWKAHQVPQAVWLQISGMRALGQFQDIEQLLLNTQEVLGNQSTWKTLMAQNLSDLGRHAEVIQCIDRLDQAQQQETRIRSLLAHALTKRGRFNQAIELYRSLLQAAPGDHMSWYNLAAALSNHTDQTLLNEGIEVARRCLQLKDDCAPAHECMALCNEKLNYLPAALVCIDAALRVAPDNLQYTLVKARILYHQNELTKSQNCVDAVLRVQPENARALRLGGMLQLKRSEFDRASQSLQRAIELRPQDQRALAYFNLVGIAQNKTSELNEINAFVQAEPLPLAAEFNDLSAFNSALKHDVMNHSLLRKNPAGLAARNGHMTDDLMADETVAICAFKRQLEEAIHDYIEQLPDDAGHPFLKHKSTEYELNLWATWVKGDGFIDKHIHEESWLSGAYYVDVPEITQDSQSHQGYFQYGCIPADMLHLQNVDNASFGYIKPQPGLLVIFPSYLYHQTIPHESEDDRISIAFDLTPTHW